MVLDIKQRMSNLQTDVLAEALSVSCVCVCVPIETASHTLIRGRVRFNQALPFLRRLEGTSLAHEFVSYRRRRRRHSRRRLHGRVRHFCLRVLGRACSAVELMGQPSSIHRSA